MPVENRCGSAVSWGLFPMVRTDGGDSRAHMKAPAGSPADRLRPAIGLSYPSRVCSTTGDAIDRIVEAIDQLANDAQGKASGRELAARVADLWLMVSALDPELARRRQGYTKPADGAPSA